MIYLDQAATSHPKPPEVIEAITTALNIAGSGGRGAHQLSLVASRLIFEARSKLARFFGASDPRQIVFTSGATESLNLALFGTLQPGDHVITTATEHNSVLRPLYLLEKSGVEMTILPANQLGVVDVAQLQAALRPQTKAVVCNHASNVTGNVLDLDPVFEFCQAHNLLLILDAAQTAGWYAYDLAKQPIDILCFTGHKALYGPQGIGGMYVRPDLKLRPFKVGGSGVQTFSKSHPQQMPEALEAGTLNTPGIAGLLAGVRHVKAVGLGKICQLEAELTQYFYNQVRKIPGVKVYGDFSSNERCPIVTLNIVGFDSSLLSQLLAEQYGICTRPGGHCAPLLHEALGTRELGAVRFSFSYLNREKELDAALGALSKLAEEYGVGL